MYIIFQTKLSAANTNTNLSMIFEPTLDETPIGITNLGISTATINFNKPLLVNLTEEYGPGNEPTKEWCDQNLDYNYPFISFLHNWKSYKSTIIWSCKSLIWRIRNTPHKVKIFIPKKEII